VKPDRFGPCGNSLGNSLRLSFGGVVEPIVPAV
jgi:hypothetical protein